MPFFDIEDAEDGLLEDLLEGRIVEVERDEDKVCLRYADGRELLLIVHGFGLRDDIGIC